MEGSRVRVNGTTLWAERSGVGADPAVLVHGSWVDHTTFDRLTPLLEPSLTVLRYDRRGHGRSGADGADYSLARDAADLAALLEATDLFPVHVVGHSLGATVALELGLSRPELVRSLVLHEPPLLDRLREDDPEALGIRAAAEEVAAQIARGDEAGAARTFVERVALVPSEWDRLSPSLRSLLVRHAGRWAAEYASPGVFDLDRERLRAFDPPVLLTVGALSRPAYHRIADDLAKDLPNVRRRDLPGAGHLAHATQPAQFAATVLGFALERNVPPS